MKRLVVVVCLIALLALSVAPGAFGSSSNHGFTYTAESIGVIKERWRQAVAAYGYGCFFYCVDSSNTERIGYAYTFGYRTPEGARSGALLEFNGLGMNCLRQPAEEVGDPVTLRAYGR